MLELIWCLLVPAIPSDTLSQLNESLVDNNSSSETFQSVSFDITDIIQEITYINPDTSLSHNYSENSDEIPDMDDFHSDNLMLANDPVSFTDLYIVFITLDCLW